MAAAMEWAAGLAGGGVGCGQLGIGGGPDTGDTTARTEEEGCRSECYECHKQRILDQVLTLFVFEEVREKGFHESRVLADRLNLQALSR
jgi:hypothetical protein